MLKKLAALPVLAFIVLIEPLRAIAQQTAPQPPQGYYGPGPGHMWIGGHGEHFFWMLPLMMLFVLLVAARFSSSLAGHAAMECMAGEGRRTG
jgi:hypothetical protein